MDTNLQDELSLRDVFAVLKRHRGLILILPIALALLTLVVTLLLPKSYSSRAVYSLSIKSDEAFAGLPTAAGLAQAYGDLLSTSEFAAGIGVEQPINVFQSKFDDKKGLWTLTAKDSSAAEAKNQAAKFSRHLEAYLNTQLLTIAKQKQTSSLAVSQISLLDMRDQLRRVEPLLKDAQTSGNSTAMAAALEEQQGVGAQTARAPNPASVSLQLQVNTLRLSIAKLESAIVSSQRLLATPNELRASIGQVAVLQVVTRPGEPLEPDFPKPVLFAALAAVLGLLIALIAAFVLEALREPRIQLEARGVLVSAD